MTGALSPRHLALGKALGAKIAGATLPAGGAVSMVYGVVQAVNTGPASVDVKLGGSSVTVPALRYAKGYTPTVGDTVYVWRVGADYLVQGAIAT